MSTTELALWGFALVLGAVVIIAAVAFLEELYGQVERVRHHAQRVWTVGKQVAANTATALQLQETSKGLERVEDEVARHDELLQGGGRR